MTKWTHFYDMCSGGNLKEPQGHIYIEAPEEEAIRIFEDKLGHNPHYVTCECCGPDYSINDYDTLEEASGYQRNCKFVIFNPSGEEISSDEWYNLPIEERRKCKQTYVEDPTRSSYRTSQRYVPLDEYITSEDVLVIRKEDL